MADSSTNDGGPNDLSRKLTKLRQEKYRIEEALQEEQGFLVNGLKRKLEKQEAREEEETRAKQINLEKLRRENVVLENNFELKQKAFVYDLWERIDKLKAERHKLQSLSDPVSPREISNGDTATNLSAFIRTRSEVERLKQTIANSQQKYIKYKEEQRIAEDNISRLKIKDIHLSRTSFEIEERWRNNIEQLLLGASRPLSRGQAEKAPAKMLNDQADARRLKVKEEGLEGGQKTNGCKETGSVAELPKRR